MSTPTAEPSTPTVPDHAPTTVVFDVGEVLIDETRVWAVWAEIIGVSPLTFAAVLGAAIVQGESSEAVFAHLAPNLDWRHFVAEHDRRYGGFREDDLYPDVRACLDDLTAAGFDVVIAGNQPAQRQAELQALQLPHRVMAMSEALEVSKPDPAFFDAVQDLAGRREASDLLYVGDRTDNDVTIAASRGWRTCWLRRGPWGQLQDLPEDVEDPDLVLEGLGELATLLQSWRGADA